MINFDEKTFDIYKERMNTGKWYTLILVFLSSFLVCFMYIEQLSYEKSQRIFSFAKGFLFREDFYDYAKKERIHPYITDSLRLARKFDSIGISKVRNINDLDPGIQAELLEYGHKKYKYFEGINSRLQIRHLEIVLPIIGLTIPGNDVLPIICLMMTILVIAFWLNVRSIHSAIRSLDYKNERMKKLIFLNYTFTGVQDSNFTFASNLVQGLSNYLPLLTMVLCSIWDYFSAETPGASMVSNSYSELKYRYFVLFGCIVTTAIFTSEIRNQINRIDFLFEKEEIIEEKQENKSNKE